MEANKDRGPIGDKATTAVLASPGLVREERQGWGCQGQGEAQVHRAWPLSLQSDGTASLLMQELAIQKAAFRLDFPFNLEKRSSSKGLPCQDPNSLNPCSV